MPVSGGQPLRLPMRPDLDSFQPRWSPDGRWIAFDLDGNIQQFAVFSDGERVAFNVPSGGDPELWLLGDFLHLVKADG